MSRSADSRACAAQAASAGPAGSIALHADTLVEGKGRGRATAIGPLSFWGGYDSTKGLIVDRSHEGFGQSLAGRILVMPRAKGSSSSSSVLVEALRNGTGPAGIVLSERDLIITIGAIVASELYSMHVPVVVADDETFRAVASVNGAIVEVVADSLSQAATIRVFPE